MAARRPMTMVQARALPRWAEGLHALLVSLWAGGLVAVGYLAAPVLFHSLPENRMLAGMLAGEMFRMIGWFGLVSAGLLLVLAGWRDGWRAIKTLPFWLVVAMAACDAAGLFGIQPIMEALKAEAFPRDVMETLLRDRFATWHGVSSVVYMIQSLCGLGLVVTLRRGGR